MGHAMFVYGDDYDESWSGGNRSTTAIAGETNSLMADGGRLKGKHIKNYLEAVHRRLSGAEPWHDPGYQVRQRQDTGAVTYPKVRCDYDLRVAP
jgi:hypothetical protein